MPPRPALIVACALAAFVICAGVLAVTLPPLLADWHAAQEPATGTQSNGTPRRAADGDRVGAPPDRRRQADDGSDEGPEWVTIGVWWFAGWTAVGGIALTGLAGRLVRARLRHRATRDYGLYELHLSMHDEAKPQDLEDMIEAIANVVRAFPEDRARFGQPFIAFELHYGPADNGLEWTLAVRCQASDVKAIDGAIAGCYPDVRIGHLHGEEPERLRARLPVPGHVLRYRKARSFVYALSSESDKASSPPIEAIAQAQAALGKPSSVRFQLIPAPLLVEDFARSRFRRHENKLVRTETWGASEAGLRGSLNQQEMREGKRTQNRSLFWLEVQVAAGTREDANRVGAAVQARRGDNVLRRRWMLWPYRLRLYRERFPTAYPPLLPTMSLRSLVSSAEIAHLLELPGARMKGVPVRRTPLPRLPAPPEVRCGDDKPLPAPPVLPVARGDVALSAPTDA